MNRFYAAVLPGLLLAGAAAAQEEHTVIMAPQVRVMSLQGGVMGKTVKGAPYSGVEVTETNQVLADGTRIHNENQTQVYRDSEGRMRRETPNEVTIWDPVANTSWVLNPKTQTARKLPMGTFYYSTRADAPNGRAETMTYTMRVNTDHPAASEAEAKAMGAKLKAEVESQVRRDVGFSVATAGGASEVIAQRKMVAEKGATEPLGKRMIEGVNSEGTKTTMTTEAGAIGNDRAIQSTSERWFSPELQTVMLTKHSDPRTGEESFKLINVSRTEPPPYLFTVPAGYQVVEQK